MRFQQYPWLCLGLLLLSSCALDENAAAPAPPAPAGANVAARSDHPGAGAPSPTPRPPVRLVENGRLSLAACLRYGLEENLDIEIADIRSRSAAQEIEIARADFDPNVHGFVGQEFQIDGNDYTEAEAAISKKFSPGTIVSLEGRTVSDVLTSTSLNTGYPNGFTSNRSRRSANRSQVDTFVDSLTDDSVTLRLRQPLLRGAGRDVNQAPLALAHLSVDAADTARRAEIIEFLRGAETAYWTAAIARQIHRLEESGLQRNRMILDTAKRRTQAGTATNVDFLEAEAGLAKARKSALQAKRRSEDAVDNLRLILGMPLGGKREDIAFESLERILPTGPDPNPDASYRKALASYPDVILLANTVRQNEIGVGIARNNLLPAVDVEASSRWRSNDGYLDHEIERDLDWGVLLQFSVPWTLRAEHAELRRAEASLHRGQAAHHRALRDLEKEILAVTRSVSFHKEQLQVAAQVARVSEKKWEEQQLRFRENLVPVRDLVEAQRETLLAQTRELETRLRLIAAFKLLTQLDGSILSGHGFTWN